MKKIVAITHKGQEYMYSDSSAHTVPAASALKIMNALNEARLYLKNENQTWHLYDIDDSELEWSHAYYQKFCIRKGYLFEGRR